MSAPPSKSYSPADSAPESVENEMPQTFTQAVKPPSAKERTEPPISSEKPLPPKEPQPPQKPVTNEVVKLVQQMGESVGTSFSDPFEGKGQRLEGWAELVENAAAKASDLVNVFEKRLNDRAIPKTSVRVQDLIAPGIVGERRRYFLITRDVAMVAVYIAGFGKDLYVSWVLYAQGEVALSRAIVLGLLALLLAIPGSIRVQFFGGSSLDTSSLIVNAIIVWVVLLVIVCIIGYVRHRDAQYYLRSPLNEFQQDDLLALALAVHKSLLHAIDSVGIDTKLLSVKEQFGAVRGRLI